jgi:hypothetical protein
MAVPANPSVGSRALYYPAAVPAPVPLSAGQPGTTNYPTAIGGFTQFQPSSIVPPDIGAAGVPLPAIVVSIGGVTPDFSGTVFAVHLPNGQVVPRSAGFASGQPLLSVATWTTAGSNPLQARWALMDALA